MRVLDAGNVRLQWQTKRAVRQSKSFAVQPAVSLPSCSVQQLYRGLQAGNAWGSKVAHDEQLRSCLSVAQHASNHACQTS